LVFALINGLRALEKFKDKVLSKTLEKTMVTAMNKRLITLSVFVLAALLYFIGFAFTATIFVGLAVVAEIVFWLRFFRRDKSTPQS